MGQAKAKAAKPAPTYKIDFTQNLTASDGEVLERVKLDMLGRAPKNDKGEEVLETEQITAGEAMYDIIHRGKKGEPLNSTQYATIDKLATRINDATGPESFSARETDYMLYRVEKDPGLHSKFKAALVLLIDPTEYERANDLPLPKDRDRDNRKKNRERDRDDEREGDGE